MSKAWSFVKDSCFTIFLTDLRIAFVPRPESVMLCPPRITLYAVAELKLFNKLYLSNFLF